MILSGQRAWSLGMGGALPQPIPWSEMVLYAREHGLDPEETVLLLRLMDAEFRELVLADQARKE